MTYYEFRDRLCGIDPSKDCLRFLAERIASDGYRGMQYSQHNRYDMDFVCGILEELYKIAGTDRLAIRTTDLSKRPYNTEEERQYAVYVNALSERLGRCTQDSVRKNLFVDLHRMGLLERYNRDGVSVEPYRRAQIKYVRISALGLDFIEPSHSLIERKLLYTRAIDTLTEGLADELLETLNSEGMDYIAETEFQFFYSFRGERLGGNTYSASELVEYIGQYRSLSRFQREEAVAVAREYCAPDSFEGDKTDKRDFHNWLNETQQIFMLMDQTAYYEINGERLNIRVGNGAVYGSSAKLKRSQTQKAEYFKNHAISAEKGFELHHIVPLCWAKSVEEFDLIDVWENMIYIDGYKHSVITQNGNRHVRLRFNGDDIGFCDNNDDEILCGYHTNVRYAVKHKDTMLSYNKGLLYSYGRDK